MPVVFVSDNSAYDFQWINVTVFPRRHRIAERLVQTPGIPRGLLQRLVDRAAVLEQLLERGLWFAHGSNPSRRYLRISGLHRDTKAARSTTVTARLGLAWQVIGRTAGEDDHLMVVLTRGRAQALAEPREALQSACAKLSPRSRIGCESYEDLRGKWSATGFEPATPAPKASWGDLWKC
jgi:hypothetical protein